MAVILWIVVLVASAIGWLLAQFVNSILTIDFAGGNIVPAFFWFLIAITCFFVAGSVKKEKEGSFGLISLDFFVTWMFSTIGVILGALAWILIDTESLSVNFDQISAFFFFFLPLTIGTTLAASLGLRE
jgi:hypothetical protein